MKKFTIIIALMLVALTASAQSAREKGWVLRPEVNAGYYIVGTFENVCTINTLSTYGLGYFNHDVFLKHEGSYGAAYNLSANYGYMFNPIFFLGAGVGINGYDGAMSLPVYINPRIYLGNRGFSCFFDFKVGYNFGISAENLDINKYYIPNWLLDYTNYYYNGYYYTMTENYFDFVTIDKSAMKIKGYYFSVGFGFEIKRHSFGFAFDLFNANLETTLHEHYYSYPNAHINNDPPTIYHNKTVKYDDSNTTGFAFTLKYGYSIF